MVLALESLVSLVAARMQIPGVLNGGFSHAARVQWGPPVGGDQPHPGAVSIGPEGGEVLMPLTPCVQYGRGQDVVEAQGLKPLFKQLRACAGLAFEYVSPEYCYKVGRLI